MTTDTRAVVVGGASGIGAAAVQHHRRAGHEVLVWDRDACADVVCDVADAAEVADAVAATLAAGPPPDLITVTAGIGHSGTLLDVEPDDFDRVMAINTKGPWLVMRSLARACIDAGTHASMVATSSVSASIADRSMGPYCASKAALSMLVRVAAAEWAPEGIRVNAVAPGVTDTPMLGGAPVDRGWLPEVAGRTALGRLGTADDIAEAILAVHAMSWVTGQIIDVDGGLGLHSPIDAWASAQERVPTERDHRDGGERVV